MQPLALGALAYLGVWREGSWLMSSSRLGGVRASVSGSRSYESGNISRFGSKSTYSVWTLSLFLAFLVYDVDLALLIPEASPFAEYGSTEVLVFVYLLVMLSAGVWYDYRAMGFSWE